MVDDDQHGGNEEGDDEEGDDEEGDDEDGRRRRRAREKAKTVASSRRSTSLHRNVKAIITNLTIVHSASLGSPLTR